MIKDILKKNKNIFNFFKNLNTLRWLLQTNVLKIFNPIRKSNCGKNDIRCEFDIKNVHYKYTVLGNDTPICCLTHLYEITRDITSILNHANIDYFIMYGTLLGQVRHNKTFIPWDTDVDVVVMLKDKDIVVTLLKQKLFNRYHLIENKKILKMNFSTSNLLHADIYFWDEDNDILIDSLNDHWVQNRVTKSDVFPVVMSKLYDLDIKIPKNATQVLKKTYGDNCLDIAFKKYAYKKEIIKTFKSTKIDKKYLEIDE
ncbi:MAG: Unknown protein [uncultured Sulfurovum sp.]|uniref:LicD/FKTN/FKRP nucleotidyltransferase domain-containing protein n=1 Tax=uncultured Sulfurovum sp. TaxID=269237 RepID=A0A6S6SVA1_9BACT|nr:MAG: Unknown protein [uncultured Sulfurovum sp.]